MSPSEAQSPDSLPDLYAMLGLRPLESDRRAIKLALTDLAQRIKSGAAGDQRRLRRVFELGKTHLLDPQRKSAYDEQWRAVYGREPINAAAGSIAQPQDSAEQSGASDTTWDWDALRPLLPGGDPAQPFDMAAYLESQVHGSNSETEDDDDYRTLVGLVAGASAAATAAAAPASPAAAAVATPVSGAAPKPVGGGAVAGARPAGAHSTASLAKKIRRKRDRSLLLVVGGVLASLATVLGVLLFLLNRDKVEAEPERPLQAQAAPPSNSTPAASSPASTPQRGSGLAAPPGLDALAPDSLSPSDPSLPPGTPPPSGPGGPNAPMDTQMGTDPATRTDSGMTVPGMSDPADRDPAMRQPMAPAGEPGTLPPNSGGSTPEPSPPPTLSPQDKEAWKALMTEIRQLLGQQQYASAREKLEAAEDLAVTPSQVEQLNRLKRLAGLAEDFYNAMLAAINGLGAGEVFTAGTSTPVSFVEGSSELLVVRVFGRNQRYRLTELPLGIAFGLAQLKMDVGEPVVAARQAAFALLHPKTSSVGMERARKLMQEAIAAGVVPEDMMQVFEEDYSL